ncbi:MAG: HNH endonuclease [Methanoregulaceae archaeon]|nr:HNH endonuclease [Methanoregulaceae archaeon]
MILTKKEFQLFLTAFDVAADPACGGDPGRNGFLILCYQCPFSERREHEVFCIRYRRIIRARAKYGLPRWRGIRAEILARDGFSCRICGSKERLQVHHIDQDFTCDDPSNLMSLCETCHARIHSGTRVQQKYLQKRFLQ